MSKIIRLFLFLIILIPNITLASSEVSFFWGDGCSHCTKVLPVIEDLKIKYPEIKFKNYEVYRSKSNVLFLYRLYDKYNVPEEDQGSVPLVFVGEDYMIGDKTIIENLEKKILTITDTPEKKEINPNLLKIENIEKEKYSIWAITGAALVDSINPCAIAVLLILLTALIVGAENKRRAIRGGLAFILSIYIGYFLFGLGLIKLINIANISKIISKIAGIIAIIIGLANLKDFLFYGKGFVMEIPRRWRPSLKKMLNKITSPLGAFLIGFVVILFELPCTGGPYFFVISLLAQKETLIEIIPTLLYYNLVFILPLLIILLLIYLGISSIEKAKNWKDKNIKILHLISGLIMLALGIWVLLF
ncbi:MAG: cytochrome c biogenesis protein CcdA [Patescibacteria group bacterium]|nr:cytochrome c biogenesis protein CcdA [Patescibacteria group bacterium]